MRQNINFHRRITEKSFRSQGNNNGAESLAKIIDKPSKADHTASYIRHTPLRKIVTILDYTNRKKTKKKTNPHTTESTGNGAQRSHEENR